MGSTSKKTEEREGSIYISKLDREGRGIREEKGGREKPPTFQKLPPPMPLSVAQANYSFFDCSEYSPKIRLGLLILR